MSIVQPALNEVFSIRIYKSLLVNPMLRWANTYEVRMLADSGPDQLVDAVDRCSQFEKLNYVPQVRIEYATVSTFVPDSKPYNGDEFIRVPINSTGMQPATGDDLAPLQLCLRIAFTPATGRTGFRLYRGMLREPDYNGNNGNPTLQDIGGIGGRIASTLTSSGLDDLIVPSPVTAVQLVLASAISVRPVGAVGIGGITVKKLNNRYYDRA